MVSLSTAGDEHILGLCDFKFDHMDNTRTICNIISLTANTIVGSTNLDQALSDLDNTDFYRNLSSEVKKHFERVVRAYTSDVRASDRESDMVRLTHWVIGKHHVSKQTISVQCPEDKFDKLVRMGFEESKGDAIYDTDDGVVIIPRFVHVPIIDPGREDYVIM
jgi:hypothetical protein